jgi:hypothetical protein
MVDSPWLKKVSVSHKGTKHTKNHKGLLVSLVILCAFSVFVAKMGVANQERHYILCYRPWTMDYGLLKW